MELNEKQGKFILYAVAAFLAYKVVYSILRATGAVDDKNDVIADQFISSIYLTPDPYKNWMRENGYESYINNLAVRSLFAGSVERIWNAKGFFNDDEEAIFGVFRALPSKIHVSAVSYYFTQIKGRSLPDFLNGFMDSDELTFLNSIVNSKPSTFSLNINQ